MGLTIKDESVLGALRELQGTSGKAQTPTEIGMHLGFSYDNASGRVSRSLKKPLELGMVTRLDGGRYEVATDAN